MQSQNIIGEKWASDELHIQKCTDKSWVISFQLRGILDEVHIEELTSIFSCLIECMDFPCGVVFDFSCIEQLNEYELGSFLAIALLFQKSGCQIVVCKLSVQVLDLFERQNLEARFHFAAEQEDALFALKFSSSTFLEPGNKFHRSPG